eukprot:scaffold11124_cov1518-Chaetoceros_neogracile.AAC.2
MKINRAIMNLYKDNKALQKLNDGLELEVRSCKKEKIAILEESGATLIPYVGMRRQREVTKTTMDPYLITWMR